MKINTQATNDNQLLVSVSGEFDALGCQNTKAIWNALLETDAQQSVILDLTDTTFLDSSGVGAIVFLFKRLRTKGTSMFIAGANGQPQELLDLLRIHQAIPATERPAA